MIALLAGMKTKIIAAGAVLAAAAVAVLALLAKGRRAGRAAERQEQGERVDEAEKRKDGVVDPGDSGVRDKLRDGRF